MTTFVKRPWISDPAAHVGEVRCSECGFVLAFYVYGEERPVIEHASCPGRRR